MPEELTELSKQLIFRCPWLVNQFAEKINSMICNFCDDEALEPISIAYPDPSVDIQDLISHVGYSDEQCGYGEFGK